VKRISGLVYEETRGFLKKFLENVRYRALVPHCELIYSIYATTRLFVTRLHTLSTPRGLCLLLSLKGIAYIRLLNRKTVTALDVVYALKRSGHTLYGFGA
jgi:histone H4